MERKIENARNVHGVIEDTVGLTAERGFEGFASECTFEFRSASVFGDSVPTGGGDDERQEASSAWSFPLDARLPPVFLGQLAPYVSPQRWELRDRSSNFGREGCQASVPTCVRSHVIPASYI